MIAALTALLMRKETDSVTPERPEEEIGPLPAEIVFRKWKNAMFRAAFGILGDDGQAEDAVMDALEKICANPERFRIPAPGTDDSRLKLLVMRTVENAALDRYRKRKRRLRRESPLPSGEEDREGEPEENSESAEEVFFADEERNGFGTLEEAVRALPEKYRTLLALRYGEEYGNREIAAMLGIPESTVATWLARAREALKRKIGEG